MSAPPWDCAARRGLTCRISAGVVSWLAPDGAIVVETRGGHANPSARLPGGAWQSVSSIAAAWDLAGFPALPAWQQGALFG